MSISVQCTSCGRRFDVPVQAGGNSVTCPYCGAPLHVLASTAESAAPQEMAFAIDMGPPQPPRGSGLAITSLVLGILGIVPCFFLIPSVLALVFGIVALAKNTAGRGMAIAGTVLGGLAFLLLPINLGLLLPAISAVREAARQSQCGVNLREVGLSIIVYRGSHNGQYPPDLNTLVTAGLLDAKVLHCPSKPDKAPEPDYVYAPGSGDSPPDTFVVSDAAVWHPRTRNVLRADGRVTAMPENDFQQQLQKPQNRRFAAALAAVGKKPPADPPDGE